MKKEAAANPFTGTSLDIHPEDSNYTRKLRSLFQNLVKEFEKPEVFQNIMNYGNPEAQKQAERHVQQIVNKLVNLLEGEKGSFIAQGILQDSDVTDSVLDRPDIKGEDPQAVFDAFPLQPWTP